MPAPRPVIWMIRVAILLAVGTVAAMFARPVGLGGLRLLVAVCFRDVPAVATGALAAELASGPAPLLLDARSAEEFAVSHLPGARHASPEVVAVLTRELPRATPVVTYCSVGWRSAALARQLRGAGFVAVRNLDGSAFVWANEGRPLAGALGPVGRVHPWAGAFAFLLVPAARGPAW